MGFPLLFLMTYVVSLLRGNFLSYFILLIRCMPLNEVTSIKEDDSTELYKI